MAPREQVGQPDLLPQEEVLHLRETNRWLLAEVSRLNSVVARLEADGVRRDQAAADLVQVGQGKCGANSIILLSVCLGM